MPAVGEQAKVYQMNHLTGFHKVVESQAISSHGDCAIIPGIGVRHDSPGFGA